LPTLVGALRGGDLMLAALPWSDGRRANKLRDVDPKGIGQAERQAAFCTTANGQQSVGEGNGDNLQFGGRKRVGRGGSGAANHDDVFSAFGQ